MTVIVSETRERFLLAIARDIPVERIAEIHFFQPLKQGGIESGVAVIAARRPVDDAALDSTGPYAPDAAIDEEVPEDPDPDAPAARFTVFTARYRLVLKGPDRGQWEASVVDEADAPLLTVDAVVRGVQRRAGDVDDPERLPGDDARAIIESALARREAKLAGR